MVGAKPELIVSSDIVASGSSPEYLEHERVSGSRGAMCSQARV